jgi:hypothetical protein
MRSGLFPEELSPMSYESKDEDSQNLSEDKNGTMLNF